MCEVNVFFQTFPNEDKAPTDMKHGVLHPQARSDSTTASKKTSLMHHRVHPVETQRKLAVVVFGSAECEENDGLRQITSAANDKTPTRQSSA